MFDGRESVRAQRKSDLEPQEAFSVAQYCSIYAAGAALVRADETANDRAGEGSSCHLAGSVEAGRDV